MNRDFLKLCIGSYYNNLNENELDIIVDYFINNRLSIFDILYGNIKVNVIINIEWSWYYEI